MKTYLSGIQIPSLFSVYSFKQFWTSFQPCSFLTARMMLKSCHNLARRGSFPRQVTFLQQPPTLWPLRLLSWRASAFISIRNLLCSSLGLQVSSSPCERRAWGGSKFYWKKKSAHPRILCQRIFCLSVCNTFWPQLSPDLQNRNRSTEIKEEEPFVGFKGIDEKHYFYVMIAMYLWCFSPDPF